MKGRQLKPTEAVSKAGVTETSKVIGVLRNKKPVSVPAPQPPVPQPPTTMAPPVPLPKMEPLVMKEQPTPKPEMTREKKITPNPASETDEDYAKTILSSEMFIPLLYNCSLLPRNCEQLLDLIREKDSRLFNYIVGNPSVLTDAIVEVSKLLQERVRQAINQGRENMPHEEDVIHLTEDDVKAIETLMQLGFSQEEATIAYLSCDKNVELAASYLYGN
ncbi:hypothetical protein WA538_002693 [Blastocystis sp. DL]